jgi:hypothetical protein
MKDRKLSSFLFPAFCGEMGDLSVSDPYTYLFVSEMAGIKRKPICMLLNYDQNNSSNNFLLQATKYKLQISLSEGIFLFVSLMLLFFILKIQDGAR